MIFQWYLFVLLLFVGVFAYFTQQTYTVNVYGHREKHYRWLPVLIMTVPLIYIAGNRSNSIGDTAAYRSGFFALPSTMSGLPDALATTTKDKGFTVFSVFLKSFIGEHDVIYFTIIAAICLLCVAFIYKKYSCNYLVSMFLFLASADYIQWTHNGMRQFIAVAIIFAATGLLLKKKYIPYIIIILLVSTIHASALIMIPICFVVRGKPWNLKTVLFLVAVFVAIASTDQFTGLITDFMENTQYSGEVDQFLSTEGTNMLRVAVFSIPAIASLVFKNKITAENNHIINLSVGMSIATMGAYIISAFTSGIFIGRIPIYFSLYNYILIPWLIERYFTKRTAKVIYGVMIICYLVFYYYQVSVTWKL